MKLTEEMKEKEEKIKKDREEQQQSGSVGWRTYYLYFTGGGNFLGVVSAFLVVFLFVASQALMIVTDYWLSYWYLNQILKIEIILINPKL